MMHKDNVTFHFMLDLDTNLPTRVIRNSLRTIRPKNGKPPALKVVTTREPSPLDILQPQKSILELIKETILASCKHSLKNNNSCNNYEK